jgi:hypothetical protein
MSDNLDPKFEKSEKQKEETRKILQARHDCHHHRDLTKGARLFFDFLLDYALNPEFNFGRRGQIAMGQIKISEKLSCCTRSITTWKHELISACFVWVTKWPMPNVEPLDCYHITALQPKKDDSPVTTDGIWGNGYRRNGQMSAGKGGRGHRKNLPVIVDRFGKPISSSDFSQVIERKSIFGKNFSSQPKEMPLPAEKSSAENGNDCSSEPQKVRQGTANNAVGSRNVSRSEPKETAADNGKNQSLSIESEVRDSGVLSIGGAPPQSAEASKTEEYKAEEVPALVTHEDLVWKERLGNKWDKELRRLQGELKEQLRRSKTEGQKALLLWRIQQVEIALFGAPHPDEKKASALLQRPARPAPQPKTKPLSQAEIAAGALTIARSKLRDTPDLLSEENIKCLVSAGEKIPVTVRRRFPALAN